MKVLKSTIHKKGSNIKKTAKKPHVYTPNSNIQYAGGGQFGDFLQSNAGSIGSIVGMGVGSLIAPGAGTMVGASLGSTIGGGIGNMVQGSYEQDQSTEAQQAQQLQQQRQLASINYMNNAQPQINYGANFAGGGDLPPTEFQEYKDPNAKMIPKNSLIPNIIPPMELGRVPFNVSKLNPITDVSLNTAEPQLPQADLRPRDLRENLYRATMTNKYNGVPRSIPKGERINPEIVSGAINEDVRNQQIRDYYNDSQFLNYKGNNTIGSLQDLMASPEMGQLRKLPNKANGGALKAVENNPNITVYDNGGSHSQNKFGGIPIGDKGKVEQGEIRWGNYIFSDRLGK